MNYVVRNSAKPADYIPTIDLFSPHGFAYYGNCWRLVNDGIGWTLYKNRLVYLKYSYRANVFDDIKEDIRKGTEELQYEN